MGREGGTIQVRGASIKPAFADTQSYLSSMLYSVKIKAVDATMGTNAAYCFGSLGSFSYIYRRRKQNVVMEEVEKKEWELVLVSKMHTDISRQ